MRARHLDITLVGGPTVIIDIAGRRLLTDPTFDPPGEYASGTITLVKTAGPAVPLSDIGNIDAVLLSHDQHADNLDSSGRALLRNVPVTFTTEIGAKRLGGRTRGLGPFMSAALSSAAGSAELTVTATPARHGPAGIEPISGDVIGFLIGQEAPGDTAYITGDTVWYEGTADVARRYSPRVVIVFAGSAEPRGSFHMTMNTNDVISAAFAFPNASIIAVHNHGWDHFAETADQLRTAFATLGLRDRLITLDFGKTTRISLA